MLIGCKITYLDLLKIMSFDFYVKCGFIFHKF